MFDLCPHLLRGAALWASPSGRKRAFTQHRPSPRCMLCDEGLSLFYDVQAVPRHPARRLALPGHLLSKSNKSYIILRSLIHFASGRSGQRQRDSPAASFEA